jgi:hypothetical protein
MEITEVHREALENKIDSFEREVMEIIALAEADLQNTNKAYVFLTEEYKNLREAYMVLTVKHEALVREVADGAKKTKAEEEVA